MDWFLYRFLCHFGLCLNDGSLYESLGLDIIAANDWDRPIYFAVSVSNDSYLGLQDYFQLEGVAYRLVSIKNTKRNRYSLFKGRVNTNVMYTNLMDKFEFGNMNKRACI